MPKGAIHLFGQMAGGFLAVAIPGQNNNMGVNVGVSNNIEAQVNVCDYIPHNGGGNKITVNNFIENVPAPAIAQVQVGVVQPKQQIVNVRSGHNMVNTNVQHFGGNNQVLDIAVANQDNSVQVQHVQQQQQPAQQMIQIQQQQQQPAQQFVQIEQQQQQPAQQFVQVQQQQQAAVNVQQVDVLRCGGGAPLNAQVNICDEMTNVSFMEDNSNNNIMNNSPNVRVIVNEVPPPPPQQQQQVVHIVNAQPQQPQQGTNVHHVTFNQDLENIAVCNQFSSSTPFLQVDTAMNCFTNQPEIMPEMIYDRLDQQMNTCLTVNQMTSFASNFPRLFVSANELKVSLQSTVQPTTFDNRKLVIVRTGVEDCVQIMPAHEYAQGFRAERGSSSSTVINNFINNYGTTYNRYSVGGRRRGGRRSHRSSRMSRSFFPEASYNSRSYRGGSAEFYSPSQRSRSVYSTEKSSGSSSGRYYSHNRPRPIRRYVESRKSKGGMSRQAVRSRPHVEPQLLGAEDAIIRKRSARGSRGPSSRRRRSHRG